MEYSRFINRKPFVSEVQAGENDIEYGNILEFGKFLKQARLQISKNVSQIADQLGVSNPRLVFEWESGRSLPAQLQRTKNEDDAMYIQRTETIFQKFSTAYVLPLEMIKEKYLISKNARDEDRAKSLARNLKPNKASITSQISPVRDGGFRGGGAYRSRGGN